MLDSEADSDTALSSPRDWVRGRGRCGAAIVSCDACAIQRLGVSRGLSSLPLLQRADRVRQSIGSLLLAWLRWGESPRQFWTGGSPFGLALLVLFSVFCRLSWGWGMSGGSIGSRVGRPWVVREAQIRSTF